jgi:hypothetical protein
VEEEPRGAEAEGAPGREECGGGAGVGGGAGRGSPAARVRGSPAMTEGGKAH